MKVSTKLDMDGPLLLEQEVEKVLSDVQADLNRYNGSYDKEYLDTLRCLLPSLSNYKEMWHVARYFGAVELELLTINKEKGTFCYRGEYPCGGPIDKTHLDLLVHNASYEKREEVPLYG